jgi:hypothetical protein
MATLAIGRLGVQAVERGENRCKRRIGHVLRREQQCGGAETVRAHAGRIVPQRLVEMRVVVATRAVEARPRRLAARECARGRRRRHAIVPLAMRIHRGCRVREHGSHSAAGADGRP